MLLALFVALPIAALALAARALTLPGAVAAVVIGAACILAGWGWAALLILYFVVSVAFSKLGADAKSRRTGSVVAKAGGRDAIQVLANGGVFALAAFLAAHASTMSAAVLAAAAAGALAASAADTLATEVGTLVGGEPLSITQWRAVPAGTSGGVTVAGSLAMVGGALEYLALILGFNALLVIVAVCYSLALLTGMVWLVARWSRNMPYPANEEPGLDAYLRASQSDDETSASATGGADAGSDDLTQLSGIGPKAAGALTKAGIATYASLAEANEPLVPLTGEHERINLLDP